MGRRGLLRRWGLLVLLGRLARPLVLRPVALLAAAAAIADSLARATLVGGTFCLTRGASHGVVCLDCALPARCCADRYRAIRDGGKE